MFKKISVFATIIIGLLSFGRAQEELDAKTERCHILNSQIFHWRADYFEDARFNDSVVEAANEGLAICAPESFFEQEFTFHLVEAYVHAGDEDALLHAINHLLDHYQEFDFQQIKEYAENHFSMSVIGAQLLQVYNGIQ